MQDEASQLVAAVANAGAGDRVLDACAAPGGKTVALAAAAGRDGFVVAGDVRPRRIDLLRADARAVRCASRSASCGWTPPLLPFGPVFDLVLLDAPCSGLGTIRRDPEIRWRRTEADLPVLAARQRAMLERAARAVKPGGRLVFATCSSEPEENEDVVAAFLGGHPAFAVEDPREPPGPLAALAGLFTPEGFLRTWPHAHGLEAFFARGSFGIAAKL